MGQRVRGLALVVGTLLAVWAAGPLSQAAAQAALSITSAPPPVTTVGTGYLHQFTASPTSPTPSFAVTSGTLPPGLTLSSAGFVTGTATTAGTYGPTTVCATNGVAAPACQTFTIVVDRRTPGILLTNSAGGPVGTPVRAAASLVGAFVPTGTVTFRLFSDAGCTTQVFISEVPLDQGAATSADYVTTAPGTYYWRARYNGDVNNDAVESPCDPARTVTITGTGTTTTTTTSTTTTTVPPTTTSSTTTTVPPTTVATTSTSTSTSTSTTSTSTSTTVPTGTTSSSTTSSSTTTTSTSTTTTVPATTTTTTVPATTTTVPATTTTEGATTTTVGATTTTVGVTTTTSAPATTTTAGGGATATSPTTTSVVPTTAATVPVTAAPTTVVATTVAPGPTVTATPQQVAAGDPTTLSGNGFPPAGALRADLFSDPVLLGTTTADATGAFRLTVTVPRDTAPGFHVVRVSVVGGGRFAETTLFVSAPAQPLTAAAVSAQSLSRTGGDPRGPARLAAGLLAAGFLLVGLAWRRQPEPAFRRPRPPRPWR